MDAVSKVKNVVDHASIDELVNIEFGKSLMDYLPEGIDNDQQQRSILADTIHWLIQRRLDALLVIKKLYTLGEFYFALQIPKEFLR